MKIKILTIAFNDQLQRFDTSEMDEWLKTQCVMRYEQHFVSILGLPYWTVLVETDETTDKKTKREAFKSDDPLLQELLDWRRKTAKDAGLPPYIVATNVQMKEIAAKKIQTLKGFEQVHGYGTKKIEQYGKLMIEIIAKHLNNG